MAKYTVQEPPATLDTRYLSGELHRIESNHHAAYKQIDGATDAGPHAMVALPTVILTYVANRDIKAGSFVFFECIVTNPNQQLDTVIFEIVVGAVRDNMGSMMIDQTTTASFSVSDFSLDAIPKGTVVTIEAYRNKRDGITVTDSKLTLLEI